MKKHPVDDMFAKRLSKWEPEASPDLWNRIEARQKKAPRRLGSWYWFAAAGVAITLLSGYLVWQSESSNFGTTANTTAQKTTPQSPQKNGEREVDTAVQSPDLLAGTTDPDREYANSSSETTVSKKASKQEPKNKVVATKSEPATVLEDIQVAAITREETTPEPLVAGKEEIGIQQTVEIPALDRKDESRVIIAHVQIEDTEQDDQKSSKFIRILRQLKNAKQGDAVDWDEVGFNPKKLVARADERLRNEEDKISKQYQNLKEKTKL